MTTPLPSTPSHSTQQLRPDLSRQPPLSLEINTNTAPLGCCSPPSTCINPRRSPLSPRTRNRRRRARALANLPEALPHSSQNSSLLGGRWWSTYQPINSFGSAISRCTRSPKDKQPKKTPQKLAQPVIYRMLSVPFAPNAPQKEVPTHQVNAETSRMALGGVREGKAGSNLRGKPTVNNPPEVDYKLIQGDVQVGSIQSESVDAVDPPLVGIATVKVTESRSP